jgi:glycosyltransferase involved in cell wall biosynthesis
MGERGVADVQELYRAMDVVAVPSLIEGFGLSAAEAMAAARPVVGTKVGGLQELIPNEGAGRLVDSGNAQALARELIELLKNPSRAGEIGAKGRMPHAGKARTDALGRTV